MIELKKKKRLNLILKVDFTFGPLNKNKQYYTLPIGKWIWHGTLK